MKDGDWNNKMNKMQAHIQIKKKMHKCVNTNLTMNSI